MGEADFSQQMEVLCIGHASWDIFLYLEEFPREDRKQLISQSDESPGGPASNAASLLGQWGVRTAFAGVVGDDLYGRAIAESFTSAGVDTSYLEIKKGLKTALSTVLVNTQNGSRTIITRRRDPSKYRVRRRETRAARETKFEMPVYILADGHEPEATMAAMEEFPVMALVLDAGGYRESTVKLASYADFLIASEGFTAGLLGIDGLKIERDMNAGLKALEKICSGSVAVTLGSRGCAGISSTGEIIQIPAVKVETLDSTGAGDIFHGAFVYALKEDREFEDALRFANYAAALSVGKHGGRASIPQLEDVVEGLKTDNPDKTTNPINPYMTGK